MEVTIEMVREATAAIAGAAEIIVKALQKSDYPIAICSAACLRASAAMLTASGAPDGVKQGAIAWFVGQLEAMEKTERRIGNVAGSSAIN